MRIGLGLGAQMVSWESWPHLSIQIFRWSNSTADTSCHWKGEMTVACVMYYGIERAADECAVCKVFVWDYMATLWQIVLWQRCKCCELSHSVLVWMVFYATLFLVTHLLLCVGKKGLPKQNDSKRQNNSSKNKINSWFYLHVKLKLKSKLELKFQDACFWGEKGKYNRTS